MAQGTRRLRAAKPRGKPGSRWNVNYEVGPVGLEPTINAV